MRQIVVPLQIITMSDVSDEEHDFEHLAVLHVSASGNTARVWGQTDTGIRVSIELPLEILRSAPTAIFEEQVR